MFDSLLVGEGSMGGFVEDWLRERDASTGALKGFPGAPGNAEIPRARRDVEPSLECYPFDVVAPSLRLGYSFREYVRFEADARERHEYVRGLILAMAGGTLEHARRTAKVIELLGEQIRGKRCSVFDSNARVRVPSGNAYHPDASVICGEVATDAEDALSATNPTVLVEVLSPSTAEYDRTDKLDDYRRIASLRHAVLIADDAVRVDVWSRTGNDWSMKSFGPGERAALGEIGCMLDVDEIYRDPLAP